MGESPYLFIIHHLVDVDGGLGVLAQVPLLLAQEPFPALRAQFWANTKGKSLFNCYSSSEAPVQGLSLLTE